MELLNVLHFLSRHRLLTAVGVLLALATGAAAAGLPPFGGASTEPKEREALVRVLVDTPSSLQTSAAGKGAETIVERAALIGETAAREDVAAAIARGAGLRPADIAVFAEAALVPPVISPLPEHAAEIETVAAPKKYVVALRLEDSVPILDVKAIAPDARAAVRLADATVAALQATTRYVAARPIPGAGVVLTPLGEATLAHATDSGRPSRVVALGAAIILFSVWCAAIVITGGALGAWRRAWSRSAVIDS